MAFSTVFLSKDKCSTSDVDEKCVFFRYFLLPGATMGLFYRIRIGSRWPVIQVMDCSRCAVQTDFNEKGMIVTGCNFLFLFRISFEVDQQ